MYSTTRILLIMISFTWHGAANLLPHEIDFDWGHQEKRECILYDREYLPSGPFANGPVIQEWMQYCNNDGIACYHNDPWVSPMPDELYREYMQKSIMQPDLRNETHKNWGVKSCRMFKAISYGILGMTNAPKLANFVDESIVCHENIRELYDEGMSKYQDVDLIQHQMKIVRDKHTFMNRSKGILKLL